MQVWITKYALTQGIFAAECEISDDMAICRSGDFPQFFHREGRDWHRDRDSASARARAMVADKLASLEKQKRKLQKLVF